MAYNNVAKRNSVTVDSTTPIKIFDTNTATRIGWRVVLPTTITAGVGVRFQVQTAGSTAPTKADMLLGRNLSDKQKALRMKAMGEIVSLMAIMGLYAALKFNDLA